VGERSRIDKAPASNLHPRRTIGSVTNPHRVGSATAPGVRIGGSTLLSDRWRSNSPSSFHGTIGGRISDNWAGYISFGHRGENPHVSAGLFYYDSPYKRRCYPYAYRPYPYYYGYSPFWSIGAYGYRPCYGYTYSSVYYPEPYYYRNSYTDVYVYDYDDDYVEAPSSYATPHTDVGEADYYGETVPGQSYVPADSTAIVTPDEAYPAPADQTRDSTMAPDEGEAQKYENLAAPGENTLIGRGNAAFAAGQYDEARHFYISVVMADERDGYAKFLYALSNFAAGDYGVAGLSLRRALLTTPALVEYPPDARALYPDPAVLMSQLDGLSGTVAAGAMKPDVAQSDAVLLLGYLQFAIGEPQRASETLAGLVHSDPDDTAAAMVRDAALRASKP
jgi:tetratricopeptide (TPR) repeat protein